MPIKMNMRIHRTSFPQRFRNRTSRKSCYYARHGFASPLHGEYPLPQKPARDALTNPHFLREVLGEKGTTLGLIAFFRRLGENLNPGNRQSNVCRNATRAYGVFAISCISLKNGESISLPDFKTSPLPQVEKIPPQEVKDVMALVIRAIYPEQYAEAFLENLDIEIALEGSDLHFDNQPPRSSKIRIIRQIDLDPPEFPNEN